MAAVQDIFQIRHTESTAGGIHRDGTKKLIPRNKFFIIERFSIQALTNIQISLYLTEYGLPFVRSYARHGNDPDEKAISDQRESVQKLYLVENLYIPKGTKIDFESLCKEYKLDHEVELILRSFSLGDDIESKMMVDYYCHYKER